MKNMKKISAFTALLVSLATPLVVAAQTGINVGAITPYSNGIMYVINVILVPILMAIAFIVFLWGVYKYFIYEAENESEKAEGRKFAMWGVIGFVIILSLWGIVNLLMGTLGLSVGSAPPFPTIGGQYVPGGTQTPGGNVFGGSPGLGGSVSPAQSAAQTSLQTQYANLNRNCPPGSAQATSASCQQQIADYQRNLDAYNQTYSGSTPTNGGLVECPDGSYANGNAQCPVTGGMVECSDGTYASSASACANGGLVQCPDGTYANGYAACTSNTAPNGGLIQCSDGTYANAATGCDAGTVDPNNNFTQ